MDSNQFCSISNDRTFKLWDAAERAYIDTFYGHKNYINSIDTIGPEDFITSGFDRNTIYWKVLNYINNLDKG